MRGAVLLLAAGGGTRLGCGAKAFVELDGVTLLRRAADRAAAAEATDELVVAVPPGAEVRARGALDGLRKPFRLVEGGETRQRSAARALAVAGDVAAVVVHDAARALCPPELFDRCFAALDHAEAAMAAWPVHDTIKEVAGDVVAATLDRAHLVAAQTPQAFRTSVYRLAHEAATRDGFTATDDAALVERLGVAVRVVPGDERNLKITTAADLAVARELMGR